MGGEAGRHARQQCAWCKQRSAHRAISAASDNGQSPLQQARESAAAVAAAVAASTRERCRCRRRRRRLLAAHRSSSDDRWARTPSAAFASLLGCKSTVKRARTRSRPSMALSAERQGAGRCRGANAAESAAFPIAGTSGGGLRGGRPCCRLAGACRMRRSAAGVFCTSRVAQIGRWGVAMGYGRRGRAPRESERAAKRPAKHAEQHPSAPLACIAGGLPRAASSSGQSLIFIVATSPHNCSPLQALQPCPAQNQSRRR